jgi:hypothetical protein
VGSEDVTALPCGSSQTHLGTSMPSGAVTSSEPSGGGKVTNQSSAVEAVAAIPGNAVVALNSSSGLCCPDAVLPALGARFEATGTPRKITTIHPIAAGDVFGTTGEDHIARPGLPARIIGGSPTPRPSSPRPTSSPISRRAASTARSCPSLEIGADGSVNVSRLAATPHRTAGAGGFVDITTRAKGMLFSGTFNAGAKMQEEGGRLVIDREGHAAKVVPKVDHISFASRRAVAEGRRATCVTERCVMQLTREGLKVSEVAGGGTRGWCGRRFRVRFRRVIDASDKSFLTRLFDAAVRAADPKAALGLHLPARPKGRTVVIGAGKGAAQMGRGLRGALGRPGRRRDRHALRLWRALPAPVGCWRRRIPCPTRPEWRRPRRSSARSRG